MTCILSKEAFAKELRLMAECMEKGDSFEGNVTWSIATNDLPEDEPKFEIKGCFRYGNLEGQGFLRMYD